MRPTSLITAAGLAALVACGVAARADGPTPGAKVARAALAPTPPTVDGRLDDAAWQAAPAQDDFVERTPTLRGAPAERTSFRMLVDGAALYVAIACHDSQPEAIQARTLQQDSTALFDDDAVSVKIDPLRDRRTSYGFVLNAAGGRLDYRGVDDGVWQIEVDLVWQGAAVRTPDGWSAELRIPWTTLGIDPANAPAVSGLDITRDVSRLHASYDWTLIPPPHQPIAASQFGALEGLDALLAGAAPAAQRETWALSPWALVGFDDPPDADLELAANAGLDLEAELGRGYAATLTLNTDFAQAEVDDATTNLDRFDLFLAEKRDFFLKDGDLFGFGDPGWATLFHSRTIGLKSPDTAEELPILAGLKVGGRTAGGFHLGALSVLTRPEGDVPWRLDSVLRLQQTFGTGSAVGFMSTWRQSLVDAGLHNVTLGADADLSPDGSPLLLKAYGAATIDALGGGKDVVDGATHVELRWRGELFRPRVGYAYFGPKLRAGLGYFQRTGTHNAYLNAALVPRIGRHGLKALVLETSHEAYLAAPGGDLTEWTSQLGGELDWDSGTWAGIWGGLGEVTVGAFTVGDDHAIAAGTHGRGRLEVAAGTPTTAAVSGWLSVVRQQYFGGWAWNVSGNLVARPGPWLGIQLDAAAVAVTLPDDDFVAPTVNLRLTSGLTTDLELSAFVGWSGLEHGLSFQTRLRWTFAPGDDLFAVWALDLDDATGLARHHSFVAKVALRFP